MTPMAWKANLEEVDPDKIIISSSNLVIPNNKYEDWKRELQAKAWSGFFEPAKTMPLGTVFLP